MPSAVFSDSRFRLDYSVSVVRQEVTNNRSLVRTVLVIVKTGSSYAHSGNTSSWAVGWPSTASGTFTYNFGNYSSIKLVDRQDWVAHDSDGAKSFTTAAQVTADAPLGSAYIGAYWVTLPTIPRATTPAMSGGFVTGTSSTISLPRASGSFTHDVSWRFGTKSGSLGTGLGTSVAWTPPHSILTELTHAASSTVAVTVVTKSGSTVVGSKSVAFPLVADASITPSVSNVLWDDANPIVKTNIGAFVQGMSLVKGTVAATGTYGSTIVSKRLIVGGQAFPEDQLFQVATSGTITASGEATDSRGRTNTKSGNFTVLPYAAPQLGVNEWQVRRANSSNVADTNGQYLRIDLHAIAQSLKPGSTEKNALRVSVRTRPTDGAWTNRNVILPGLVHNTAFQVSGGAAYLASQSYVVEISLTDNTGGPPLVLRTVVGTTVVTIDMRDNRVGLGKMHERGALDVAGEGYASAWRADTGFYVGTTIMEPIGSGKIWFSQSTPPSGWLLCQGQAVSRTTYAELYALMGTVFGDGNNSTTFNLPDMRGRVPVGVSTAEAEFDELGKTFGTKTHTLTTGELPSNVLGGAKNNPGFSSEASSLTIGGGAFGWVGRNNPNSGAHNNIQPSVTVNWIIRAL